MSILMKAAVEYQTDGNYAMMMFSFILLLPEDPTRRQKPLSSNTKYSDTNPPLAVKQIAF